MGKLIIINGSPRAPRSNSKRYADLFKACWVETVDEYSVTSKKHASVCQTLGSYSDVLLVFPLYADGIPVTLMHFLKEWELHKLPASPMIHVLINCGFLEPEQNETACEMIRLFCRQNGLTPGSTLCIGSGEAILDTPFSFLVRRKIKRLADSIRRKSPRQLKVTMPLPPSLFVRASTNYWTQYGAKNQLTREEMETMSIEGSM